MSSGVETSLIIEKRSGKNGERFLDFARNDKRLNIIAPVYVWESVVAPFTLAQKFFIDIVCRKLIVQSIEAGKMIHRAFGCVFACCSGFHEECPVARLREQKFAGQLL